MLIMVMIITVMLIIIMVIIAMENKKIIIMIRCCAFGEVKFIMQWSIALSIEFSC